MKGITAVLLLALVCVLTGCTDDKGAIRVLKSQGFTDIKTTGYRWCTCDSKDDNFSTGFEATSASGQKVTGAVCSGLLKGNTVRFD